MRPHSQRSHSGFESDGGLAFAEIVACDANRLDETFEGILNGGIIVDDDHASGAVTGLS